MDLKSYLWFLKLEIIFLMYFWVRIIKIKVYNFLIFKYRMVIHERGINNIKSLIVLHFRVELKVKVLLPFNHWLRAVGWGSIHFTEGICSFTSESSVLTTVKSDIIIIIFEVFCFHCRSWECLLNSSVLSENCVKRVIFNISAQFKVIKSDGFQWKAIVTNLLVSDSKISKSECFWIITYMIVRLELA